MVIFDFIIHLCIRDIKCPHQFYFYSLRKFQCMRMRVAILLLYRQITLLSWLKRFKSVTVIYNTTTGDHINNLWTQNQVGPRRIIALLYWSNLFLRKIVKIGASCTSTLFSLEKWFQKYLSDNFCYIYHHIFFIHNWFLRTISNKFFEKWFIKIMLLTRIYLTSPVW